MRIFFSVGEPSGDQHGAHLIEELKRRQADIEFVGFGGPLMDRAGCRLHFQLTQLAVMGFLRVIPLLWQFYKLVQNANRYFREHRPDAVVLIDFPGFNWWIARKAKKAGIPVFYYLPPQLWAWAPWRVKRMRKFVDHVLCALPFETAWYAQRGVEAEYVGHPFFDEVADAVLDQPFIDERQVSGQRNVGILPGSRNAEVDNNWPMMIAVIQQLHAAHPSARFFVACYKEAHREFCANWIRDHNLDLPVELHVNKTSEIVELVECCLMVSGSISLELLARKTPAVVTYRISRFQRLLSGIVLRCRFLTLPNLIADRELMPERFYAGSPSREATWAFDNLNGWLSDSEMLAGKARELARLCVRCAETGATARTAEAILSHLPAAARRFAA
jgi:lipid-A-disaccharide synthase